MKPRFFCLLYFGMVISALNDTELATTNPDRHVVYKGADAEKEAPLPINSMGTDYKHVDNGRNVTIEDVRASREFDKNTEPARLKRKATPDLPEYIVDSLIYSERPVPKLSGAIAHAENWRTLGVDEVPYMAVLYKENVKVTTAFEPGSSCGGALLSANKVLTICACVRSFSYYTMQKKAAPGTGSKFDIKVSRGEAILLEFSTVQFAGKDEYRLSTDSKEYNSASSCFKMIQSGSKGLEAEMVVMPFLPKITSQNAFRYVLWPPYPIHEKYKLEPDCALVEFGAESLGSYDFLDSDGALIDTKSMALTISFMRGEMTTYCKGPALSADKTTCFQRPSPVQLCQGVIGFPIAKGDDLAGLSATPVDCQGKEGSMLGAVFTDQSVKEIETYLGKDLNVRESAAHTYLYREPETMVRIIPDYSTSDEPPKTHSLATKRVAYSTSLVTLWILSQVFT